MPNLVREVNPARALEVMAWAATGAAVLLGLGEAEFLRANIRAVDDMHRVGRIAEASLVREPADEGRIELAAPNLANALEMASVSMRGENPAMKFVCVKGVVRTA